MDHQNDLIGQLHSASERCFSTERLEHTNKMLVKTIITSTLNNKINDTSDFPFILKLQQAMAYSNTDLAKNNEIAINIHYCVPELLSEVNADGVGVILKISRKLVILRHE